MRLLPWSHVSSWVCTACGDCCREYTANISFREWMRITKLYGIGLTNPGLTEFYLKKRPDGRCVFQYPMSGSSWLCGLQDMKPQVCKLWPFRVLSKPAYGREGEALYLFNRSSYYVYVDPNCRGIFWGDPGEELVKKTLPELIELASGKTSRQIYSTSQLSIRHEAIQLGSGLSGV